MSDYLKDSFNHFRARFFYLGAAAYIIGAVKDGKVVRPVLTFDRSKARIFTDEGVAQECVKLVQQIPTNRYLVI